MQLTYHIRITKDYAASVIEDLRKMKAIELLTENEEVAEWQKDEVRQCVKDIEENPAILIDEDVVFNILKRG